MPHAGIRSDRHPQCSTEGFEHGLDLVVRVFTLQIIDVQGDLSMIDESLEKLPKQIHIKATHHSPSERHLIKQTRPS